MLSDGRQPDTHAHCQGCHLSGARAESKTDVGLGEGMTWVPRHRQCPVGAGAPAHSSFLAGTRVRATMMGTRARQLMTSAHRGRWKSQPAATVSKVSEVATHKAKAFRPMLTRSRKMGNQSTVGKREVVRLPRPPCSAALPAPPATVSGPGREEEEVVVGACGLRELGGHTRRSPAPDCSPSQPQGGRVVVL